MPKQIAFNVIPKIDSFQDNGYTREEMKMVWETRKILEDETLMINPTTVRVPVFYGHSEAVHLETRDVVTAAEVRQLLSVAPGVTVIDDPYSRWVSDRGYGSREARWGIRWSNTRGHFL